MVFTEPDAVTETGGDAIALYYNSANPAALNSTEPARLILPIAAAPALEALDAAYPSFVPIADLPLMVDEDTPEADTLDPYSLVQLLYDHRIVVTQ